MVRRENRIVHESVKLHTDEDIEGLAASVRRHASDAEGFADAAIKKVGVPHGHAD